MATTTLGPNTPCELLKLPPEIRNMIYEKVLFVDDDDNGYKKRTKTCLLRCNKQIYREAKVFLYKVNTWRLTLDLSEKVLENIGEARIQMITPRRGERTQIYATMSTAIQNSLRSLNLTSICHPIQTTTTTKSQSTRTFFVT